MAGVSVLTLLLTGCNAKEKRMEARRQAAAKEEKVQVSSQTLNLPNANSTQYGPGKNPKLLWFVEWKEAKVDVGKDASATDSRKDEKVEVRRTQMEGVSGFLFKDGKRAARFVGDGGMANKTDQILELAGHVKVISIELPTTPGAQNKTGKAPPPTTLTCDRLVYDAKMEVIKALGHVQVVNEVGTIGTLAELWATRDLKVVATPNMFKKP